LQLEGRVLIPILLESSSPILSEWLAYLSRVFLQQELHEVGHLLLQVRRQFLNQLLERFHDFTSSHLRILSGYRPDEIARQAVPSFYLIS
jgi:hypothetical protein